MSGFTIVGDAPSVHGLEIESADFIIQLARTGDDGPLGYVILNKHTGVYEYVARSYTESISALKTIQEHMDTLRKQARPSLKTVQ